MVYLGWVNGMRTSVYRMAFDLALALPSLLNLAGAIE
jgi:hypothetical protein